MFVRKEVAEYVCVWRCTHACLQIQGVYKWACLMFLRMTVCPTGTPYIRSGGVPLNELGFVLSYSRGTVFIISGETHPGVRTPVISTINLSK